MSDRVFVEAVVWVLRTGAPWRDLEPVFGPWKRIYNRFRRWALRGWWLEIFRGTSIHEEVGSILDASIVRAHQDSCGGRGGPAANAIGRSRGGFTTKLHAVVTMEAKPIEIVATAGHRHEATLGEDLLDFVRGRACLGDGGYDADRIIDAARTRDLEPVIPPSKSRNRKRKYDRELYRLRYRVEVFFHNLKRNRRIATRYDKSIACFMGFVHVACFLLSA
jgi:transposase